MKKNISEIKSKTGEVLTLKSFKKSWNYLRSDEYAKKEDEAIRFRAARAVSMVTATNAFAHGEINLKEFKNIMSSLALYRGLIVSPKTVKKLEKAKRRISKGFDQSIAVIK